MKKAQVEKKVIFQRKLNLPFLLLAKVEKKIER